jgi:excisionase family DNA binding protein
MPMPAKTKTLPMIEQPLESTGTTQAPTPGVLLTPEELAERLAVPQSWVREKTRERARIRDKDPLPVVRLGKYVRFSWPAVQAWLARQGA